MKKLIHSNNKEWGFYGTVVSNYRISDATAEKCYDKAANLLISNFGMDVLDAKSFLDSRYARHLVDSMSNVFPTKAMQAIDSYFQDKDKVNEFIQWFNK